MRVNTRRFLDTRVRPRALAWPAMRTSYILQLESPAPPVPSESLLHDARPPDRTAHFETQTIDDGQIAFRASALESPGIQLVHHDA
jgi:hypothetical protein